MRSNEWSAMNNIGVKIDYITSMGEKDKLTASAEAQARTGHDIILHRDWMISSMPRQFSRDHASERTSKCAKTLSV